MFAKHYTLQQRQYSGVPNVPLRMPAPAVQYTPLLSSVPYYVAEQFYLHFLPRDMPAPLHVLCTYTPAVDAPVAVLTRSHHHSPHTYRTFATYRLPSDATLTRGSPQPHRAITQHCCHAAFTATRRARHFAAPPANAPRAAHAALTRYIAYAVRAHPYVHMPAARLLRFMQRMRTAWH